ncbi:MAG: sulfotransferase family protein [Gaiellaceae bacterium]
MAGGLKLHAAAVARVLPRGGGAERLGREERLVFVLGSPRSGTTFLASTIGALPGFVDLGEVLPFKSAIPDLVGLQEDEAARRVRRILERVRRLALVRGLRGVEQTPETAFVVQAAARAYPQARRIHLVRDGRDVVCSLLERGWLNASRDRQADDVGGSYGARARFWVEPDRVGEFEQASDATRAAWAWRRYVSAARSGDVFELRYEDVAADPERAAAVLGEQLGVQAPVLLESLSRVHARSVGRYRSDLTADHLRDVEREAGPLLAELGYE